MADEQSGKGGGGGHGKGTPLDEATPERRKQWKDELQKQGKYTPGASLKELIAERDGEKSLSDSE